MDETDWLYKKKMPNFFFYFTRGGCSWLSVPTSHTICRRGIVVEKQLCFLATLLPVSPNTLESSRPLKPDPYLCQQCTSPRGKVSPLRWHHPGTWKAMAAGMGHCTAQLLNLFKGSQTQHQETESSATLSHGKSMGKQVRNSKASHTSAGQDMQPGGIPACLPLKQCNSIILLGTGTQAGLQSMDR